MKSKLIKKSSNEKTSKEMKDSLRRKKGVKEEIKDKKREEKVKEEGIKEVIICQKSDDSEDLPRLPMTVSKKKDSEKMLICSLLDTGTSTSILSHQVAKELKLKLQPGDHVTLKTSNAKRWTCKASHPYGLTCLKEDMKETN